MRPRELFLWTVLVVLAGVVIWVASHRTISSERVVPIAEFTQRVKSGAVTGVTVTDRQIVATTKKNDTFAVDKPDDPQSLIRDLVARGITVRFAPRSDENPVVAALGFYTSTILPWFTFALVLVAFVRVRAIERRLEAFAERGQRPEAPDT